MSLTEQQCREPKKSNAVSIPSHQRAFPHSSTFAAGYSTQEPRDACHQLVRRRRGLPPPSSSRCICAPASHRAQALTDFERDDDSTQRPAEVRPGCTPPSRYPLVSTLFSLANATNNGRHSSEGDDTPGPVDPHCSLPLVCASRPLQSHQMQGGTGFSPSHPCHPSYPHQTSMPPSSTNDHQIIGSPSAGAHSTRHPRHCTSTAITPLVGAQHPPIIVCIATHHR